MKVGVLIPAYNEAKTLESTIYSLFNQSRKPDKVIVIPNNCTDNTEEIAFKMKKRYKGLEVFVMKNNPDRKAGALNFGLLRIIDEVEYVVCMDADTVLDKDLIESGVEALDNNPRIGSVCSRAGILKPKNMTVWQKLIWHLQHLEYGQFDSQRVETLKKIKVVHGMVAMFKMKALKEVLKNRKKGGNTEIYKKKNLVEDYELTLCLKEADWQVNISMKMLAWTEVPLSWKDLWKQRVRWLRGGVDSLKEHGWNKTTRGEILQHFLFVFIVIIQIIMIVFCLIAVSEGHSLQLNPWFLAVLILGYFNLLYRLKYVQKVSASDVIIRILLIPEILYSWFQIIIMVYSYYLSFSKRKQLWAK